MSGLSMSGLRRRGWCLAVLLGSVLLATGVAQAAIEPVDVGNGLAYYVQGGVLPNTPDAKWWYGCSPTSAGMMVGFYDTGVHNGSTYADLVPGGDAEASTYPPNVGPFLINDAIASAGHINDFYRNGSLGSGDDLKPATHEFDCLADYMGTSQDSVGNVNGSTRFYLWTDGTPFTYQDAKDYGVWNRDGMYGIGEYVNYCGYDYTSLYCQGIYSSSMPYGFTFAQYMAEINAGRPVIIQVSGHSMLGYGYDAANNTVVLNDTWSAGPHTMTWGGSYSGLDQWGVVCMTLGAGDPIGTPDAGCTLMLLGSALTALAVIRRKLN